MFGLDPWMLVALAAYPIPLIIAFARGHHQRGTIAVINLFLGWTFLGWVVSLAWSFSAIQRDPPVTDSGHNAA